MPIIVSTEFPHTAHAYTRVLTAFRSNCSAIVQTSDIRVSSSVCNSPCVNLISFHFFLSFFLFILERLLYELQLFKVPGRSQGEFTSSGVRFKAKN